MIYLKALNVLFAVAGTLYYLWHLVSIIRDAIVFMQFKEFIGADKAVEDLTKLETDKVIVAMCIGVVTCILWSLIIIY